METPLCKCERLLYIFSKLQEGRVVKIRSLEKTFHVSKRTIHRDIGDLRAFYANQGCREGDYHAIEFDRRAGGYILKNVA